MSYVKFSRLCYFISQFTELSPELLKILITFTMSEIKRDTEWINIIIDGYKTLQPHIMIKTFHINTFRMRVLIKEEVI